MTAWLRSDEAAWFLGVTPGAFRVLAHRNHWHRKRDGRRVLYARTDIEAEKDRRLDSEAP